MAPICPEHGMEAQVKDKVRNKSTGRFYAPFYGCPWVGEDPVTGARVYCKYRFDEKPTAQSMATSIRESSAVSASSKDQQIKYMNAINAAASIVSGAGLEPDMAVRKLEELADIIYMMNAKT